MKLLERYTLRAYLRPLVWCLCVFLGLYILLDLLGHLDEILRAKVSLGLLARYYGLMTPLVFVQVAPFACLMATLYTLSHMNRNLEIMAMRASGLNPWAIARPLLWMGALLSLAVFAVNETAAPEAALQTRLIKENRIEAPRDPDAPHRVLREIQHLATYGKGHTLLYANTFDPVKKEMEGVVILQHAGDLRLIRKITARSARWTGSQWRFSKGSILHFNAEGKTVGRPVPFESKIIRAGDRPEILERAESQAEFMNMRTLADYMERLRAAGGRTVRSLRVEYHAKPAAALACLVLTLIGIPFAIQPVRGGTLMGLSLGLGVGLVYYGANALSLALGKGGLLPPAASAWAAPLFFSAAGLRMTWRRLA